MGDASGAVAVDDVGLRLRGIFDAHGCDKGSRHGYERFYGPLLEPLRHLPVTLLEIGVWRGASIAAWLDYLPHATILAVDTFQRVHPEKVPILRHPRVRWWKLDSTRTAPAGVTADVIIDDGCHQPAAQRATLQRFRPLLRPGGRYVIEDAPRLMVPGATVYDLRVGGSEDSVIVEIGGA